MAFGYLTISGGFSIEAWVLLNGAPSTGVAMALYEQSTQSDASWGVSGLDKGRQLWFGVNNAGVLFVSVNDKTGTQRVSFTDSSATNITDNAWHHVALQLLTDGKTLRIFVDGVVVSSVASAVTITWDAGTGTIGGKYQPKFGAYGAYLWSGGLAYFAMTNKLLSANRIAEHYAAGNGGAVYYNDDEVTRLNRILDWTNTPEQARMLDSSVVHMQGIDVTNTNALDKLQETAEAASGYLFADGTTRIIYHNRRRRYNKASIFTFAESLGTAVNVDIEYSIDDDWVFNDIRGDRPFGSNVRMVDEDSIDAYGRKVLKISLPITSHEDMRNAVGWLLSKYKQDRIRVQTVEIECATSNALNAAGTGKLQIGDHITLDDLPSHAPQTTMEFIIEGIGLSADFINGTWKVTFNLSPAEYEEVFEIGLSALGNGDRVAY